MASLLRWNRGSGCGKTTRDVNQDHPADPGDQTGRCEMGSVQGYWSKNRKKPLTEFISENSLARTINVPLKRKLSIGIKITRPSLSWIHQWVMN